MKQIVNKNNIRIVGGSDSLKKYQNELLKEKYSPLDQRTIEKMIAMFRQGDHNARNILINRNLRFAFLIAKNYQHIDRPLIDLVSCANLGLIKIVDKSVSYDPSKGSWTTYISYYIQGAILSEFFQKNSLVKKPKEIGVEVLSIGHTNTDIEDIETTYNSYLIYFQKYNKLETESFFVDLRRILEKYSSGYVHALFLMKGVLVEETLMKMSSLASESEKELPLLQEKIKALSVELKNNKKVFSRQYKYSDLGEKQCSLSLEFIVSKEKALKMVKEKYHEYKKFKNYFLKKDVYFYLERKDVLPLFLAEIFGVSSKGYVNTQARRGARELCRSIPARVLRKYLGVDTILDS